MCSKEGSLHPSALTLHQIAARESGFSRIGTSLSYSNDHEKALGMLEGRTPGLTREVPPPEARNGGESLGLDDPKSQS